MRRAFQAEAEEHSNHSQAIDADLNHQEGTFACINRQLALEALHVSRQIGHLPFFLFFSFF